MDYQVSMKYPVFLALSLFVVSCSDPAVQNKKSSTETDTAYNFFPERNAAINDFEGILNDTREKTLGAKLREVQDSTGYDIAIATVDTIPPDMEIVSYATELGNRWKLGAEGKNNGLIIVLSVKLGSVAIAPGKDLEMIFNNEQTQRIIDQKMLPSFSIGNYYRGLSNALEEFLILAEEQEK